MASPASRHVGGTSFVIDRPLATRLERLEPRPLLSSSAWNLAAAFAADFVGNLPQNNPNGVWTYLGADGTTDSLVVTNGNGNSPGPATFGLGPGWADAAGHPSYGRGGVLGFPTDTVAGHGPLKIVWTAPAEADLGGVEITGLFTQATFEPDRQMRLKVFKNNFGSPFIDVPANFAVQNRLLTIPTTQVAIQPSDTLTFVVDGSGPSGNGVNTFAAFDVSIQEIGLAGDYDHNAVVNKADYEVWRSTFGQVVDPGTGADGSGNGLIDVGDYTVWRNRVGDELPVGGAPPTYTPAAIVVETTGVTLPDGTQLDISGTQTMGLQEAFDYSAAEGWDLFFCREAIRSTRISISRSSNFARSEWRM